MDLPEKPLLFDTSAESWLDRSPDPEVREWWAAYLETHNPVVSAITHYERARGIALALRRATPDRVPVIRAAQRAWLERPRVVLPFTEECALVAGEILAALPDPPTEPRRSHKLAETRADRLSRWRMDCLIASTALVHGFPLAHNNAADFEPIRSHAEIEAPKYLIFGTLDLWNVQRAGRSFRRA